MVVKAGLWCIEIVDYLASLAPRDREDRPKTVPT